MLDGTLRISATSSGKNRELDRLLAACHAAQPTQAESLALRVLAVFVPAVLLITLATGAFWLWAERPAQALFNSLAVAIVACPCGFGLAVPLAARRGLLQLRLLGLISNTPDLTERLARIDTIAFDKTGTLSHPQLVLGALVAEPLAPPELASWLTTIQRHSTHPVARPFWTLDHPAKLSKLAIEPLPALGIRASFEHRGQTHELTIGNDGLLPDTGAVSQGRKLHILLDGQLVATAFLDEAPRSSALATLRALAASGVRILLLTGDSFCPAFYQQHASVHLSLSTAAKAETIRHYQNAGATTLFVGDGLNDTEAMHRAHASIAIGSDSRAASSCATASLSHGDLSVIPRALLIARRLRGTLVRLVAFTLIYNFLGIGLAASGLLHPVTASLLMLASSATVIAFAHTRQDFASMGDAAEEQNFSDRAGT